MLKSNEDFLPYYRNKSVLIGKEIAYVFDGAEYKGVAVDIDNMWVRPDDVLKDYTINGSPCGVLEHLENGEWVK